MLYSITGWDLKENGAAKLAALLASYTALKLNKNTLILQMTNARPVTAETVLVGKQMKSERIDALDSISFEDVGIDALLRQAQYSTLQEEDFRQCVTPLLSVEKLLDIAKPSTKVDFELEMNENIEVIKEMLEAADKYYDAVFVLLPEDNRDFCSQLYPLFGSNNIKCMPQYIPERAIKNKEFTFVLPEYEPQSIYTAASIKKALGLKHLYYFERNVRFNDAAINGSVLEFVKNNIRCEKEDANYMLFKCVSSFLNSDEASEEPEEFVPAAARLCQAFRTADPTFTDAVDNEIHVVEKKEKRLFHKEKTTLQVDRSRTKEDVAAEKESGEKLTRREAKKKKAADRKAQKKAEADRKRQMKKKSKAKKAGNKKAGSNAGDEASA